MPKAGPIRRLSGGFFFAASVSLLPLTIFTYNRQPDHFAAFTLMPVWVWGFCGFAAAVVGIHLCRSAMGGIPAAAWLVVTLAFADEARTLANLGNETPQPGPAAPYQGTPVIRVVTANCAIQPASEIARWQPDVVLLQDAWPHQVRHMAKDLYGEEAEFRIHDTNGIITRWKITGDIATPGQRTHRATITLPDGRAINVVNIHLLSAATDLRLWRRGVWTKHRINRAIRLDELDRALHALDDPDGFLDAPAILGGDFNAPPGDPLYRGLESRFTDAHAAVGARWGNTYHRRFPILRIDRIHTTRHLTPVRCGAQVPARSDHRFVVADFVLVK